VLMQFNVIQPSDSGTKGRISIEPPTRIVGMRTAIAIASSRSLHSTR
jgi:hypothetical protein